MKRINCKKRSFKKLLNDIFAVFFALFTILFYFFLFLANKASISSKFLTSSNRNVAVINAVQQTKNDPEAQKMRKELSKRIADTKRKLHSVSNFVFI